MSRKINTAFFLFAVIGLISFAGAEDQKEGYPFDPSQIEMDDSWEEVFIDKGGDQNWCSNDKTVNREPSGFYLWDIYSKKTNHIFHKDKNIYFTIKFVGCTPDGRYVFFERLDSEGKSYIEVYNVKNGGPVKVYTVNSDYKGPSLSNYGISMVSPDGKYLAWHNKGTGILLDGDMISILPILKEVGSQPTHMVWSRDSKKAFLIDPGKQTYLYVYDVSSEILSSFQLETGNYYARIVKLSWDERKLYIWGLLGEFGSGRLFALDMEELQSGKSISPKVLISEVESFAPGPGNIIVFNVYPHLAKRSHLPVEYAGLFVADERGNVIKRLTKGFDTNPKFSQNGAALTFDREKKMERTWKGLGYALLRKNE